MLILLHRLTENNSKERHNNIRGIKMMNWDNQNILYQYILYNIIHTHRHTLTLEPESYAKKEAEQPPKDMVLTAAINQNK